MVPKTNPWEFGPKQTMSYHVWRFMCVLNLSPTSPNLIDKLYWDRSKYASLTNDLMNKNGLTLN